MSRGLAEEVTFSEEEGDKIVVELSSRFSPSTRTDTAAEEGVRVASRGAPCTAKLVGTFKREEHSGRTIRSVNTADLVHTKI